MGAAVVQQVLQAPDMSISVITARHGNPLVGSKFGNTNLEVMPDFADTTFDVLIDFTLPVGVIDHLGSCQQHKIAMVIGTTGFNDQQLALLNNASREIPIFMAANMSLGVNVCYKLLALAANSLDASWNIDILDVHHEHKKDAPSGTAKQMAKVIAEAGNRSLDSVKITSERNGETIGKHIVSFVSPHETIKIAHFAEDRSVFAKGAVTAARWIYGKQPGMYNMQDVLG